MNALRRYLDERGLNARQFGAQIGRTGEAVRLILIGQRNPSPKTAIEIEKATAGVVPRSALRPDIWPPERAA